MAYWFINFLFLFHSHISFIFSFSSVFTASISISTLPFSFFFPLPYCFILFPFMNMSHHRFPLYHHWSISFIGFFPPFVRSLLSVLSAWVQLWVWLWFPIVIGVGVGLWVVGFSSLFYIPVNWSSPFVSSESRLFESILGARTLWVDFRFRERGPGEICARESRQE